MFKFSQQLGAVVVVCGGLLSLNQAMADTRPAEKILADIKAIQMPAPPKDRNNQAAIQEFIMKSQKAAEQKAELIGELLKGYPDSTELPGMILERWKYVMMPGPKGEAMNAEIDSVLATSKNTKLIAEAAFVKAAMSFQKAGENADASTLMAIADEFIKKAPQDQRGALFLSAAAEKLTDTVKAEELNKRIEKDYPESPIVKKIVADRRIKEAVGKPFKLEFTDAIKGTPITMASLKGKVVIVDFWATWCGPCVAEMPNMKKLYAEYKDKGVEFIGVSLDQPKEQGGLDKLKEFVQQNKIEWPQYYQGNFWQSDFSSSWGINSIPCVFAVDAEGNLASTEARGKLESLIPELLAKAEKNKKPVAKP